MFFSQMAPFWHTGQVTAAFIDHAFCMHVLTVYTFYEYVHTRLCSQSSKLVLRLVSGKELVGDIALGSLSASLAYFTVLEPGNLSLCLGKW